MEGIVNYAMYSISSLLVPYMIKTGYNCIKNKPKMPDKCKKSVIFIPRQFYKSSLCDKLRDENYLFFDIDEMVKNDNEYKKLDCLNGVHKELLLKEIYESIYKDLKYKFVKKEKKHIILVSSELSIVSRFYKKNIFVCLPSTELLDLQLENLKDNEELKAETLKNYKQFLYYLQKDSNITLFTSFEELLQIVKKSYKLNTLHIL